MSAFFHFPSLLAWLVLFVCTCTYLREKSRSWVDGNKHGFSGVFYKASVIGKRLSPWTAAACAVSAFYVLFIA
jgi:hypothetical protein